MCSPILEKSMARLIIIIEYYFLLKQDYKIHWHYNKNTDGLVSRLANNLVILNQVHRVASLIGQEKKSKIGRRTR